MAGAGDVIARLIEERAQVVAEAVPGTDAARRLSDVTDTAVSALAETAFASCRARWAVVALGAYGARRVLPYSDIDLLVLSESSTRDLKPHVERLLYPLWDAALEVGHQVRSRSEHLKQCAADVEIMTSSLTGRAIAGDLAYAEETLSEVARRAKRRAGRILSTLEGRDRPGSPYLLEPDLKEGAGGQRDIDELVWRAALATGRTAHDARGLLAHGRLSAADLDRMTSVQDSITAARWRLHRSARRKTSRLTLDVADDSTSSSLHRALAAADLFLSQVRGPAELDADRPWTAGRVFTAVGHGPAAQIELERAAFQGRLDHLLPGLCELMTLRRPGLGHRLTVGAHMIAAACLIAQAGEDDPRATEALRQMRDIRPVVVAALTHDAGKMTPGPGHAVRGVAAARAFAQSAGLDDPGRRVAETLVREHLLLAETAATCDTQDDDVVLDVAARVDDVPTLGALYVLTVVDGRATGPGAWTRWHAALVGTLVDAVEAALTEPDAATIAARAQLVRIEALESLPSSSPLAPVVRAMHYRYLVGRDTASVLADAALVSAVGRSGSAQPLALRVGSGPVPDSYSVIVAVPDRPGIFATVAGCLTLAGLDILDAEAHSIGTVALDGFVVASATDAEVAHHTWSRFERELRAALAGNLALETRLEERRGHYASAECDAPVVVETDTGSSRITGIRVTAPDRVGLLHDIALEVARAGLTIVRARALVSDGVANDVFLVLDEVGQAPQDPGLLGHLAMGIRERCS